MQNAATVLPPLGALPVDSAGDDEAAQAATAAGSRALRRSAFTGAGGGGDAATVTALGSLANSFLPALSSSGVA